MKTKQMLNKNVLYKVLVENSNTSQKEQNLKKVKCKNKNNTKSISISLLKYSTAKLSNINVSSTFLSQINYESKRHSFLICVNINKNRYTCD